MWWLIVDRSWSAKHTLKNITKVQYRSTYISELYKTLEKEKEKETQNKRGSIKNWDQKSTEIE